MRKILYTFMVGALTAATLSLIPACKEGTKKAVISGFDVEKTATAEIGDYYEVPVPNVSVSEGTFDLSISATKGDDELFVVNNRVLIMDFEPHTITYTLSYLGGEEVKTTTVTPIDTTAPVVKFFGLESTLYSDTAYDVGEIVADDNSFEQVAVQVKALYVETGEALIITDNQFTTPNASGVTVRLEASATDSNSNTATQTKDFYVVKRNDYGTLDTFDTQDVSKYTNTHTGTAPRTQFSSVSSLDENEIEGIRGRALKIQHNDFQYGSVEASFIKLNKNNLVGATAFDYLTFRMYVDVGTAVKDGKSTIAIKLKETNASSISNGLANGWIEYTVEKENYPKNGEFIFQIAHWCDKETIASFTVYIDEVTGGYAKNIYLGESVDMVEALGVEQSQITDMQLQDTVGATLENGVFQCTQAGQYTIRVTIDSPPYNKTTFDYVIKVLTRGSYDDFLCLGEDNVKNYTVTNTSGSEMPVVTKEIIDGSIIGVDGKVLRLETGEKVSNGTYIFNVPKITSTQLNGFDYYTIVGYVDCNRKGFRVSALSDGVEVPESERLLDIKGKFEYRVDKKYFDKNLQFIFSDWTGTDADEQAKCLYVIGIKGGYNSVPSGVQLNLLEKTGLTADDLMGTYFESESGTQTEIDISAFTPTEAGKIVLKFNVQAYTASQVEIEVTAPEPVYDYNDFLLLDGKDATNYTVTNASGSEISKVTKELVDGTVIGVDGKVLRLETGAAVDNGTYIFNVPKITSAQLNTFDYYTVIGYVDCARNGFRISAVADGVEVAESERLLDIKGKFEYRVDKKYFDKNLQFIFSDWTGTDADEQAKCLYLISVTGGYNSVKTDKTLNLVQKTGFTATELSGSYFENESGVKTPIADLTAFTPTQAGKITLLISKDGYNDSTVVIEVNSNDLLLLNKNDVSKYIVTEKKVDYNLSNVLTQVTKEIVDGSVIGEEGKVLKLTLMTNTNILFHIPTMQAEQLNDYDYYTVVGYADCARSGFRVSSFNKNDADNKYEAEKVENIKGKFEYKVKKEYFNEYLQFIIGNQTGTNADAMKYLYIVSITGGYDA